MIKIRVKPSAKNEKIEEVDGVYYVSVKEPADKDKANKSVLRLLNKHFGRPVKIKSGMKSKDKYVVLE